MGRRAKGTNVYQRTVLGVVAATASAGLLLSGCGPTLSASAGGHGSDSDAVIQVTPAENAVDVKVTEPIVVSAEDGRITSVTVTDEDSTVPGELSDDGLSWTSGEDTQLQYDKEYRVIATAVDSKGRPTEITDTFRTMAPSNVLEADVRYMRDGGTYGVGMPIAISFNEPVTNRADIENRLNLTSTIPVVGAWSWNNSGTRVQFRPKEYWPANDTVTLKADLYGVQAGEDLWGDSDINFTFNTGSAIIMEANAQTKRMIVTRNGEQVANYPITTGKPGSETRSGIKVIQEKPGSIVMDAATLGTPRDSPNYYRLDVDYAMRITNSGEFIHAAPWSQASHGVANVSNGCIGLSNTNAGALFGMVTPGDIVIVSGTGRPQDLGNGITVWNESWQQWLASSATGEKTIGPAA